MRHAARLSSSERLQKVLDVLMENEELSTLEIMMRTNLCAVGSAISELRANGINVSCIKRNGHFYYKLLKCDLSQNTALLGCARCGGARRCVALCGKARD